MSLTTNKARAMLLDNTFNPLADTLKVILLSAAYTPSKDHNFLSSVTAYELSGAGYVGGFGGGGRKTLANKAVVQDDTLDLGKLTADPLTWAAINAGTIRYAAIGKEVTSDADSPLFAVIDVNPTGGITTNGSDWVLSWGSNGVLPLSSP